MAKLVGATSTTGYFQPHPLIPNQYVDDVALRRAVSQFAPAQMLDGMHGELAAFGDRVLTKEVLGWVVNAEHDLPYISGSGFSAFGHPVGDALVTSPGWKALQDLGISERIVALGYARKEFGPNTRLAQLYKLHLWNASSAIATCPSAMQDGAVACLLRELTNPKVSGFQRKVFERAVQRLLSTDPREAWTSGQWMTERPGGSDVRGTETVAAFAPPHTGTDIDGLPLGPWTVDGFKWFSSATDCGCVVLLARTPRGLSCFFAPTRRIVNGRVEMNGIRIQRLKNKLGTKALPTAEVEVAGMRAWLIGEEGRGVPVISALLNITRYYNSVSSIGFLGRALGIARAFARVRPFPSLPPPHNLLVHRPLFAKTLAGVSLTYRGDLALSCFVAALLGACEAQEAGAPGPHSPLVPSDPRAAALLLRVLTPVVKASTAKHSIHGVQECMEALGGVGYMENVESPEMNIARIFRDANVLAIWEGTTDVLSSDTIKVLSGREGGAVLGALRAWFSSTLAKNGGLSAEKAAIKAAAVALSPPADVEEALAYGRDTLMRIADLVSAALLIADAERDGDAVAVEIATRFAARTVGTPRPARPWREVTRLDQMIAFGSVEGARL